MSNKLSKAELECLLERGATYARYYAHARKPELNIGDSHDAVLRDAQELDYLAWRLRQGDNRGEV